ncbi:response regulator [bacterium]|nr:response regulator [bacterium]
MKALIVDDSRAMRTLLSAWCKSHQFETVTAQDGSDGLKQLASNRPIDVALVDWDMPVMNGLEMVRQLRADTDNAGLRVMMVTANTNYDSVKEAIELGADDYLMKPLTEEMLTEKLRLLGLID